MSSPGLPPAASTSSPCLPARRFRSCSNWAATFLRGKTPPAILPLTLQQPVEVLMRDGQLSGDARLAGESWQSYRRSRWISIPWLKAELTQGTGPRVTGSLIVQFRPR